jgi:hypothetical protein
VKQFGRFHRAAAIPLPWGELCEDAQIRRVRRQGRAIEQIEVCLTVNEHVIAFAAS